MIFRKTNLLCLTTILLMVLFSSCKTETSEVGCPKGGGTETEPSYTSEDAATQVSVNDAGQMQSSTAPVSDQNEVVSTDELVKLTTSATPIVQLYIPPQYTDSIEVETPYEMMWEEIGVEQKYNYDNALFSFYDRSQTASGYDGLVWIITETPIENMEAAMKHDSKSGDNSFVFNLHILGVNEEKIYSLVTISPKYTNSRKFNQEDSSSIESYYTHVVDGIEILELFVEKNNLTVPEGVVDWKEWYELHFVIPVREYTE